MLRLALIFLLISVVAGVLGFTGISAATGGIARILFLIFIVGFIVFLVLGLVGGETISSGLGICPPGTMGLRTFDLKRDGKVFCAYSAARVDALQSNCPNRARPARRLRLYGSELFLLSESCRGRFPASGGKSPKLIFIG